MIKVDGRKISLGKFPDGTFLIKQLSPVKPYVSLIAWYFENNEELVALIFIAKHLRDKGIAISLFMPYIPNARQDRVKNPEDVFTLKYFAQIINSLGFEKVYVLDPHSSVSAALIDNLEELSPKVAMNKAIESVSKNDKFLICYPDEGSVKRYANLVSLPYVFGIKYRDWETGKIHGLEIAGDCERIKGSNVLIIDDICSRGGTFYHSAKKLKELGAKSVSLYVTHCENTILEGDLLTSGLIDKVYTTNSIFTKEHEKIEVLEL